MKGNYKGQKKKINITRPKRIQEKISTESVMTTHSVPGKHIHDNDNIELDEQMEDVQYKL